MKTRPLYSSLALCAAALVSTGPASAETYEGCLTPGGSLVQVGPASADQICPPPATKITLGGSGGSGFSDWELVRVGPTALTLGPAGDEDAAETVDANCPAGKKPLGGGGVATASTVVLSTSAPYDDANGAGWEVNFYNTLNEARITTAQVYAICATVD